MGLKDSFDYSKPVALIKKLLKAYYKKDAVVLDFFAGSGTTGQAVLELNREDSGHRRFILCTNNENEICEKVTYQRLKAILTGENEEGAKYEDVVPANLKYYQTYFVEKDSETIYEDLLERTIELIQLEYGVKFDEKKYIIIMDDDEMDLFEQKINDYDDFCAVFVNRDVLMTSSQEQILNKINTYSIPDYYFDSELREAGEIW